MNSRKPAVPAVMGILNVTPDSFSDGGRYLDLDAAIRHAIEMHDAGAAIVDVGGESTRPGAVEVPERVELERVMPVVRALVAQGVPLSIDTRHPRVAEAALEEGVMTLNLVEKLDRVFASLARDAGAAVVSRCRTIREWERAAALVGDPKRVYADPMIGFGTDRPRDLALLRRVADLAAAAPTLVGVSRKRIIGALGGGETPGDRLGGSVGAAVWCALAGVKVVRVHDVAETVGALRVFMNLPPCRGNVGASR